jgi:hypothetical protein
MSQPRATIAPESTIFDLWDLDRLSDPDSPLDLFILVDSGEGEDGGGSHTPPAEFGTEDAPSKADTGDDEPDETTEGEDGGGSHTPPAETSEPTDRAEALGG